MTVKTGRGSDQFVLRLPDGMRDRIKAEAEANSRSMNAEIVATLEEKYPAPTHPADRLVMRMFQLLALLPEDQLEEFTREVQEDFKNNPEVFGPFEGLKSLILEARKERGGPLPAEYVSDFLNNLSLENAPKD